MALFKCYVYYPWIESRDSGHRVTPYDNLPDGKREFILNSKLITDLKPHIKGSTFHYTENSGDRREGLSQVICDKTPAEINTFMDSVYSLSITLSYYNANRVDRPTTELTIPANSINYATASNANLLHSVVVYTSFGFKRKEILVNATLSEIMGSDPLFYLFDDTYLYDYLYLQ